MPFFPQLPSPTDVKPPNYMAQLGGAITTGQEIGGRAMEQQKQGLALEQYKAQQAALKQYGQDKDIGALTTAAPMLGMEVEKSLLGLQGAKQDAAIKHLEGGLGVIKSAIPYLLETEKNNPSIAPRMYGELVKEISGMGFKIPPGMETYRPGMIGALQQIYTSIDTAKEKVKGDLQYKWHHEKNLIDEQYKSARLRQFDRGLNIHAASEEETRLHHMSIENKPGKQGIDYYMKAYDKVAKTDAYRDEKDPNRRVNMVENEYTTMMKSRERVGAGSTGGGQTLQQRAAAELAKRRGTAPPPAAPTLVGEPEQEPEE